MEFICNFLFGASGVFIAFAVIGQSQYGQKFKDVIFLYLGSIIMIITSIAVFISYRS